jgi:excinuclease ABC subunit A
VIQDRLQADPDNQGRAVEALEAALEQGRGRVRSIRWMPSAIPARPGASRRTCTARTATSTIASRAGLFSFNSPLGACETCRGFGRVIGIDWSLVVPDESKSLLEGAVKPIQSDSYSEVQEDLIAFAHRRGIPTDVPWRELSDADRAWVLEGEGEWEIRTAGLVRHPPLLRLAGGAQLQDARAGAAVALSQLRPLPACDGAG